MVGGVPLVHVGKLLGDVGLLVARHGLCLLGLLGLLLLELLSEVVSHVGNLEQRLVVNPLSIVCSS